MPGTYERYVCERCKGRTSWYSSHYWHDYQKIVCGHCTVDNITNDGNLELHRTGDTVMVSINFNEMIHTNMCRIFDIMSKSVTDLNYTVMKEVEEWVIIPYESPIIRKLMGRGDLNELLATVRARIIAELRH